MKVLPHTCIEETELSMRTIFIAGMSRSGTTILNIILGANDKCIAVGEVDNVIRDGVDRTWVENHYAWCTCGDCKFWPDVMVSIDQAGTRDLSERYKIFIDVFARHFPGKIPVDSSKKLDALTALREHSDCSAVHIVRDVRGWSFSHGKKISLSNMLSWYRHNRIFEKNLGTAISIGYEPLVFNNKYMVEYLCGKLSLHYSDTMLTLSAKEQHILVGNRMRAQTEHQLVYDYTWMKDTSLWPALLRPVMSYNRSRVYKSVE